jgi:hypothetical protein
MRCGGIWKAAARLSRDGDVAVSSAGSGLLSCIDLVPAEPARFKADQHDRLPIFCSINDGMMSSWTPSLNVLGGVFWTEAAADVAEWI